VKSKKKKELIGMGVYQESGASGNGEVLVKVYKLAAIR
jgi:hypothetical protein